MKHNLVNFEKNLKSMRIYRGFYMRALVLLNLLNELGKRDKMQGLLSIYAILAEHFISFSQQVE